MPRLESLKIKEGSKFKSTKHVEEEPFIKEVTGMPKLRVIEIFPVVFNIRNVMNMLELR